MRRELRARVHRARGQGGREVRPARPTAQARGCQRAREAPSRSTAGVEEQARLGDAPEDPRAQGGDRGEGRRPSILSPPSAAKSEKRAREEAEDDAHARARRPAPAPAHAQAPTPAPAQAPTPAPAAPRLDLSREFAAAPRPASAPSPLDERRAPAAATTTTMMSDDEITRRVVGGVGRYGCVGDGDLLGVSFPPELREALAKVSESHATKVSQARGGVGVGGGALEARMAAAMIQARVMLSS